LDILNDSLKKWALTYAEYGYKIFPLSPGQKIPRPGSSGVKEASSEIEKIRSWWNENPHYNIGIAMGSGSGIIGLDIDYKDGANPDFLKKLPPTYVTLTPNSKTPGHHAFFKWDAHAKNGKKIAKGVTIRSSEGYYFVAPPSVHPETGKKYSPLQADFPLWKSEVAECPEWILTCDEYKETTLRVNKVSSSIPTGSRHFSINEYVTALWKKGYKKEQIIKAALNYNETHCSPPKKNYEAEVSRMVNDWVIKLEREKDVIPEKSGLIALGYFEDKYYYTSASNKQITELSARNHTQINLLGLMPIHFWETEFGYLDEKGASKVIWTHVASKLMDACRKRGIFDADKIRGIGCWQEPGKGVICHLGDKLWVNNSFVPLGNFSSDYIYQLLPSVSSPSIMLTKEEGQKLVHAISLCNWKKRESDKLVSGWLVCAKFGAAIAWRPHLYITGAKGTGKSTFFQHVVRKVLGDMCVNCASASTEAGIRQKLRKGSLPVVFDEFDKDSKGSKYGHEEMQKVLGLARQSASEFDAKIIKGTSGQKTMEYSVRSAFLFGSIRVPLVNDADKSRFAVVELVKEGNTPDQYQKLLKAVDDIGLDFSNRCLTRCLKLFDVYQTNYKTFQALLGEIYDQRFGQLYGSILAGYWLLISDEATTYPQALELISQMNLEEEAEIIHENDHETLYNYLFSKILSVDDDAGGKRNKNLAELCRTEDTQTLQLFGCRIKTLKDGRKRLQVPERHAEFNRLFDDTIWQNSWLRTLRRMEGVERGGMKWYGKKVNCLDVSIPDGVCGDASESDDMITTKAPF